MRDAFGGIINLAIIVVFLVIVSGYLAFNVSYTKAFRVKNKIITEIERYGVCQPGNTLDACHNHVLEYMNEVGYNRGNSLRLDTEDPSGGWRCESGYCVRRVTRTKDSSLVDSPEYYYYDVVTAVNIELPIINNIMPYLRIFRVTGTTKTFTVK